MPVAGLGKPKVLKEVKLTAVAARRRCDNTIPAFKNAWARARVSLFLFIQQEIMQNHLRYFEQLLRAQTLKINQEILPTMLRFMIKLTLEELTIYTFRPEGSQRVSLMVGKGCSLPHQDVKAGLIPAVVIML